MKASRLVSLGAKAMAFIGALGVAPVPGVDLGAERAWATPGAPLGPSAGDPSSSPAADDPPAGGLERAFLEIDLWVAPVVGDAEDEARRRVQVALFEALAGVPATEVFDLGAFVALTGPEAATALAACREDACLRALARSVRSDALVAADLERSEAGLVLRLRLVETSTRVVASRVTRDISDLSRLELAAAAAVADLLPERARANLGRLVIRGPLPSDATLEMDGLPEGPIAEDAALRPALRLAAAEHHIRIVAPGHRPFTTAVRMRAGVTEVIEPRLIKNRSITPWMLGAVGVAASGLGLVLGAAARSTADDWRDACGSGRCAAGFTRFRFEEERDSVDRRRISANALFVMSGVAIAAGALWYLFDPGVDEATE